MANHAHTVTAAGTAGGTLLSVMASIHADDLVKTATLAFVGAVVSFTASVLMRWITGKVTRGKK